MKHVYSIDGGPLHQSLSSAADRHRRVLGDDPALVTPRQLSSAVEGDGDWVQVAHELFPGISYWRPRGSVWCARIMRIEVMA